jgi:hypothetical protein
MRRIGGRSAATMNVANRSNDKNRGSTTNHSKPNIASEMRSVGLFILMSAIRSSVFAGASLQQDGAGTDQAARLFNSFPLNKRISINFSNFDRCGLLAGWKIPAATLSPRSSRSG